MSREKDDVVVFLGLIMLEQFPVWFGEVGRTISMVVVAGWIGLIMLAVVWMVARTMATGISVNAFLPDRTSLPSEWLG